MDCQPANNIFKGIERTDGKGSLVNLKKYLRDDKNPAVEKRPECDLDSDVLTRANRMYKAIRLLINYLTDVWSFIMSFFNGLKGKNSAMDVFSTPLPPTCNRRILPMKPKIPILRGIQASEVVNYPLRRMLKCPVMKNEANGTRNDLQEIRKDCEDVDSRINKDTSTFRNSAMMNFEKAFKMVSKTRNKSCGNMIDWCSHKNWLAQAEISGDRNAEIFKNFAGGKLLLNLPDYKDLIQLICQQNNLHYWNVVYKMGCIKHH